MFYVFSEPSGLRAFSATAALGWIGFIEPHAGVIVRMLQCGQAQAPARVENGLRHTCFRESRSVPIADEDDAVLFDECRRKLMQLASPGILIVAWNARTRVTYVRAVPSRSRSRAVSKSVARDDPGIACSGQILHV